MLRLVLRYFTLGPWNKDNALVRYAPEAAGILLYLCSVFVFSLVTTTLEHGIGNDNAAPN